MGIFFHFCGILSTKCLYELQLYLNSTNIFGFVNGFPLKVCQFQHNIHILSTVRLKISLMAATNSYNILQGFCLVRNMNTTTIFLYFILYVLFTLSNIWTSPQNYWNCVECISYGSMSKGLIVCKVQHLYTFG